LNGILDEQKIWNKNMGGKQETREILLGQQATGWRILFDVAGLTDKNIRLIIDCTESEEGDRARAAVIKIYSYETNLYSTLNTASCTHDGSKVKTLGPYAWLLHYSLWYRAENSKLNKKLLKIEAKPREELSETYCAKKKMLKLYRGLSLPPDAIQFYKDR